jgi:transcription initiation factor IIE alpha subunit
MREPNLVDAFERAQTCEECNNDNRLPELTCSLVVEDFNKRFERMEKFLEQWMPKE